jgi:hypothetical protein
MNIGYWDQWSHAEIMSMHGIEIMDEDHDDTDLSHDENAIISEQHCCGACMDCLGLSWKDFM